MLQQTTASLRSLSVLHLKCKPSIQGYAHCLANKKRHLLDLTKEIGKSLLKNYGNFFLHFLDCFIPFRVTERALERVPSDRRRALCEQLWDQYLAQGYYGIVLQVFLHLPLLQEHFPSFVQAGSWTENPPFCSPKTERLLALCKLLHKISCWESFCGCWKGGGLLDKGQIIDMCQRKHLRRWLLKYGWELASTFWKTGRIVGNQHLLRKACGQKTINEWHHRKTMVCF